MSLNIGCPLCDAPAREVERAYPGYKVPATFGIIECATCRTQFANPLCSDPAIYDDIYRNAALVPGYDRYHAFAKSVSRVKDPLGLLAERQEPYWSVRESIKELPRGSSVLDIGSGLGYLTYALVRAGYDATGLEISENAVSRARARYGDHYIAADMFRWSLENPNKYDAVTMLEVIEHVEDPRRWIEAAYRMVRPGGMLVVTTPNREYYVDGSIWATEAPPVHLWWFSSTSFAQLTRGLDARIEFVDFRACAFKPAQPYSNVPCKTFRTPMLNEKGEPSSAPRRLLAVVGLLPLAKWIWTLLYAPSSALTHPEPGTRETLGVVLRKPGS
jgi:SAM-dependent methyltransferase